MREKRLIIGNRYYYSNPGSIYSGIAGELFYVDCIKKEIRISCDDGFLWIGTFEDFNSRWNEPKGE